MAASEWGIVNYDPEQESRVDRKYAEEGADLVRKARQFANPEFLSAEEPRPPREPTPAHQIILLALKLLKPKS